MRLSLMLMAILVALVSSACGLFGEEEGISDVAQPPSTPQADATSAPQGAPGVFVPTTITETRQSLTVWIPPEIGQRTGAGATTLSEQLLAFASSRPDVATKIEPKPFEGPGGILSYLRTGHVVAASMLPDLVVIPADQLGVVADEGLLFPFEDLLEAGLLDDLYPAAQSMARPAGQTIGYPFALTDLDHLAYHTSAITVSVPSTWDAFTESVNGQFVFPATGDAGATLALQFYLAAGGGLTNEAGQPAIQIEPLTEVLQLLSQGRRDNFIAIQSANVATMAEAWQVFQSGAAAVTPTTADQFMAMRTPELSPSFAPIPGPDAQLTPLVGGWAWAVSSADPVQKRLAVDLLTALVAGPALGEWSDAAQILPSRRTAMRQWSDSDPYTGFLIGQLESARPFPPEADSTIIGAFGDAVFDVISLSITPGAAAAAAAEAVQP